MWIKTVGRRILEQVAGRFGYKLVYSRSTMGVQRLARTVYRACYKGRCFYCIKNSDITEFMLTGRGWDPRMPEIVGNSLRRKNSNIVIEIGANIGASLIPICSDFPDATFHMFEPVPQFFELLEKNKESFQATNAHLHNCAISDKENDLIEIQCDQGNAGARVMDNPVLDIVTAKTRTLDRIFSDSEVALIKIDVDGYELNVLRGAQKLITRSKPDVFIEFYLDLMRELSVEPGDILDLLGQCGLTRFDIYDNLGTFIESTTLKSRVMEIAEQCRYYVDLLAMADHQ